MLPFLLSLTMTESDRDKVVRIYSEYNGLMTYVAEQTLGDRKDAAHDMVHDAMLKIIDKLDLLDFSDEKRTKGLLSLIVRNQCVDYLRKKDMNTVSLDELGAEDEGGYATDEVVVSKESINTVLRAIRALGDKHRDVCIMKFLYGYKDREIAELLDVAPGTVRSRINHARGILAEELKEVFYNE